MEFKVGEVVVYPHHGAAVIEAIEHREMGGEMLEYLVLQINQSDMWCGFRLKMLSRSAFVMS